MYNLQGCYKKPSNDFFLPIREADFIRKSLEDFYSTIGINPNNVEYVEGSGVGKYPLYKVVKWFNKNSMERKNIELVIDYIGD